MSSDKHGSSDYIKGRFVGFKSKGAGNVTGPF